MPLKSQLKQWPIDSTKYRLLAQSDLLNQARAGRRPARAWFLRIDPVRIVGMPVRVRVCVCVRARGYL